MYFTDLDYAHYCTPDFWVEKNFYYWNMTAEPEGPATDSNRLLDSSNDIAGLGVIIGFLGTAYLAALLFLLNYCLAHNPSRPSSPCKDDSAHRLPGSRYDQSQPIKEREWRTNPVDKVVLDSFRSLTRIGEPKPELVKFFNQSIIALCDMQLITGFGILLSAFATVASISLADWYTLTRVAWFSVMTHLSGMTMLRSYSHRYPWVKPLRAILMFILLVLLTVAYIPTWLFTYPGMQYYVPMVPAKSAVFCYFDLRRAEELWRAGPNAYASASPYLRDTAGMQALIMSLFVLHLGFFTRLGKLFEGTSVKLSKFRHLCGELLKRWLEQLITQPLKLVSAYRPGNFNLGNDPLPFWLNIWLGLVIVPLFSFYFTLRTYVDLLSSMLAEFFWVLLATAYGTSQVLVSSSVSQPDSEWEFGQMLPVLLLATPLLTMLSNLVAYLLNLRKSDTPDHTGKPPKPEEPSSIPTDEALPKFPLLLKPMPLPGENTHQQVSSFIREDHHASSRWARLHLANLILGLVAVAGLFFASAAVSAQHVVLADGSYTDESPAPAAAAVAGAVADFRRVWRFALTDGGAVWYAALGFPLASAHAVPACLYAEGWLLRGRRRGGGGGRAATLRSWLLTLLMGLSQALLCSAYFPLSAKLWSGGAGPAGLPAEQTSGAAWVAYWARLYLETFARAQAAYGAVFLAGMACVWVAANGGLRACLGGKARRRDESAA